MDQYDRRLLAMMQEDSRHSFASLGEAVGLSPSACHKRLKLLEQSGILTKQVAIVDERAAGLKTSAFVQATLKDQKEETLRAFEAAVLAHDEIMECYLMSGLSDYLMRILCTDGTDYERIHTEILTRLPGVERVVTNFAIRKIFRRTAVPLKTG